MTMRKILISFCKNIEGSVRILENKIHRLDVQFLLTNYPKIRRSLRMFNFWNFNAFIFFQSHKHNAKKRHQAVSNYINKNSTL